MKSKGIIMQPDNVRAILEGRKTQTRRIIKPQPTVQVRYDGLDEEDTRLHWFEQVVLDTSGAEMYTERYLASACPFVMGDILYVKETYCDSLLYQYVYKSDMSRYTESFYKWKSALFMPREAARIWLRVTDVRAQQVGDISHSDALAEGVWRPEPGADPDMVDRCYDSVHEFQKLWTDIHGEWNPDLWVWAYTYEVIEKPTGGPN